jgi:hypothetical protein
LHLEYTGWSKNCELESVANEAMWNIGIAAKMVINSPAHGSRAATAPMRAGAPLASSVLPKLFRQTVKSPGRLLIASIRFAAGAGAERHPNIWINVVVDGLN